MADRPLRLKIFTALYILDIVLSYQMSPILRMEEIPPQFAPWAKVYLFIFYYAYFMLLVLLWLKNRIGYVITIIYLFALIAFYFVAFPTYPTIFLILESIELLLLLSLFSYYFSQR